MLYTFDELLNLQSRPVIGKKAESLLALLEAGMPVPNGACLEADALHHFLEEHKLLPKLTAFCEEPSDTTTLHHAIMAAPLQDVLTARLNQFVAQQEPDSRWAVRSSGVLEDLAEASFAGLYTTELNVRNLDLADAIKRCWLSRFSERVQTYLKRQGLRTDEFGLGVIIQRMIPAQKSGVLFSIHPLRGCENEMLIEAVPGLGEALVSGHLSPDRYVWDWQKHHCQDCQIAIQEKALFTCNETPYTRWEPLSLEQSQCSVLNDTQLDELCQLALTQQIHCGYPVDIEWVWLDEQFYIVQSRPITRLHYQGIEGEWTTADFKDGGVSATVCTPLMWSLYDLIWEQVMPAYLRKTHLLDPVAEDAQWGKMFFGRPYWNVGAVKAGLKNLPGFVEREFDTDVGIAVNYEGSGYVSQNNFHTIRHGLRVLRALKHSFTQRLAYNPLFAQRQRIRLGELSQIDPNSLSHTELIKCYQTLIYQDYIQSESGYFYHIFDNSNATTLFKDSFKPYRERISYLKLISGLNNLSHLRQNIDLWELSREIIQNPIALEYWQTTKVSQLCGDWRAGADRPMMTSLRSYIDRYQHHATRELDLTIPRYGEDPRPIFENLQTLLQFDNHANPLLSSQMQHQAYLNERAQFLALIPYWKRKSLSKQLEQLRNFLWWREELRDLSTRMYAQIRRFTLVLAARLQAQNHLQQAHDAFFLTIHELLDLATGQLSREQAYQAILKSKSIFQGFRHFRNPDDLSAHYATESQRVGALRGVPCSPGEVTGTARVIRDIEDADRLQPGDILITRFTDPGWTPKFSLLAGVATETGGLLSHAAVIAREYGFPAVLAVPDLIKRIPDGATISLNGQTGEITLHP